jgi:hypothetical protein
MSRLDVSAVLTRLGIVTEPKGRQSIGCCPNRDHDDASPSWAIVTDPDDRKYGLHACWSCGFRGSIYSLAAYIWGVPFHVAKERLAGDVTVADAATLIMPGVEPQKHFSVSDVTIPARVEDWPPLYAAYLVTRGLSPGHAVRYGVGYCSVGRLRHRIVWVVTTHGVPTSYSARYTDFRPWLRRGARALGIVPPSQDPPLMWWRQVASRLGGAVAAAAGQWLEETRVFSPVRYLTGAAAEGAATRDAVYGIDTIFPVGGVITVVEGALKADVAAAAGMPNPVAILGKEWTPARVEVLAEASCVYVATDPDIAGNDAWERIRDQLPRHDIRRVVTPKPLDEMMHRDRVEFARSTFGADWIPQQVTDPRSGAPYNPG